MTNAMVRITCLAQARSGQDASTEQAYRRAEDACDVMARLASSRRGQTAATEY